MAEIWLARQAGVRGFEKLVVIKRMVGALEEDPEHVEMFLAEARLAAQLSHPHVVQIYELGEEQGSFYIVMEFVDGESLSLVFREGRKRGLPLPDQLAARLIAWAAEGLHYAHTRQEPIVHRDVSPQNLLVTMDGSIKLVDFGIAKIATHATSSGKLKGKLAYMAPEQGRAEAVDARTDVFGLGVCLFELVSRTRLWPKATDEMELLRILASADAFPRARERRPDAPPGLDAIIAKAMAAAPGDRFQSARALQLALEDWLLSTGSRATAGDIAEYMRELFAERVAERRALIEAAKRGELAPGEQVPFSSSPSSSGSSSGVSKEVGPLPPIATPTPQREPARAPSLPDAVEVSLSLERSNPFAQRPPVHVGGLVLAAAIALGGVGVAGWIVTRPLEAPAPVAVVDAGVAGVTPSVATLSVEVSPPEAKVRIDGADQGASPYTLEPGEHALEASAAGFVADRRTVKLAAGERVSLIVKLDHEVVAAAPEVVKRDRPAARAPKGTLRLDTVPWTTVYLGGTRLGETPILGASLPVGRHVLRLVNSEQNIEHTVEVEITANATTTKKLKLQ